jgi:hypothetical protein
LLLPAAQLQERERKHEFQEFRVLNPETLNPRMGLSVRFFIIFLELVKRYLNGIFDHLERVVFGSVSFMRKLFMRVNIALS